LDDVVGLEECVQVDVAHEDVIEEAVNCVLGHSPAEIGVCWCGVFHIVHEDCGKSIAGILVLHVVGRGEIGLHQISKTVFGLGEHAGDEAYPKRDVVDSLLLGGYLVVDDNVRCRDEQCVIGNDYEDVLPYEAEPHCGQVHR
jgi:hypothetical protein